jgi:hypothetical protein
MTKRKKEEQRNGGALIVVMIVLVIVGILGVTRLTGARLAATEAIRFAQREQGAALAEMGFNELRSILAYVSNRRTFENLEILSSAGSPTLEKTVYDVDGNEIGYYKVYAEVADSSAPDEADYYVESIAYSSDDEKLAVVSSYVKLDPVSDDVWGTNSEGGVFFGDNDHIHGSIMSNGSFYFWGSPIIEGLVQTAASYNYFTDGVYYQVGQGRDAYWTYDLIASTDTPEDIFVSGGEFNVAEIDFDSELITGLYEDAALVVSDGSVITFSNGTYTVTETVETGTVTTYKYKKGGTWYESDTEPTSGSYNPGSLSSTEEPVTEEVSTTYQISEMGDASTTEDNIIYVDGSVTVSGDVGGSVSIAATKSIYIDGGIVYTDTLSYSSLDPDDWGDSTPSDDQMLGLYAQYSVVCVPSTYGEDFNLQAAVYVTEAEDPDSDDAYLRGFCVDGYDEDWGTDVCINFYGSMIQNARGAVAQTSGNGFNKNYFQDYRFQYLPPPGIAMSSPEFFQWTQERI